MRRAIQSGLLLAVAATGFAAGLALRDRDARSDGATAPSPKRLESHRPLQEILLVPADPGALHRRRPAARESPPPVAAAAAPVVRRPSASPPASSPSEGGFDSSGALEHQQLRLDGLSQCAS
jgi:hypothetical protein